MELVWQNEKLDSASFIRIWFWTENIGGYLGVFQDANTADLVDLRFWLEVQ